MIKGKLNKAIKDTKAFQEYQETKTKMSKEVLIDWVRFFILIFGFLIVWYIMVKLIVYK